MASTKNTETKDSTLDVVEAEAAEQKTPGDGYSTEINGAFTQEGVSGKVHELLKTLGVTVKTAEHPMCTTAAMYNETMERLPHLHFLRDVEKHETVSLFLRDKKKRHYLLMKGTETPVRLSELRKMDGPFNKKVSMGPADALKEFCGLNPGSVTPLGLMNDTENKVTFVFEKILLENEYIWLHPNTNTQSTVIRTKDLLRVMEEIGHKAIIMDLRQQI